MQDQHVTPLGHGLQLRGNHGKWLLQLRKDLGFELAGLVAGFKDQGALELVIGQLFAQLCVALQQTGIILLLRFGPAKQ